MIFSFTPNKINADIRGYVSCGSYLEAIENDDVQFYSLQITWIMGLLSGMNLIVDTFEIEGAFLHKVPDYNTIKYSIEKYCKDNPMNDALDAVIFGIMPELDRQ